MVDIPGSTKGYHMPEVVNETVLCRQSSPAFEEDFAACARKYYYEQRTIGRGGVGIQRGSRLVVSKGSKISLGVC